MLTLYIIEKEPLDNWFELIMVQCTPLYSPEQNIQALAEWFYHPFKWHDWEISFCQGFMFHLKFMQSNPECKVDPI